MRNHLFLIILPLFSIGTSHALEYSDIKCKYRVDVDLFFKMNIAIGWRNWATLPEAEIVIQGDGENQGRKILPLYKNQTREADIQAFAKKWYEALKTGLMP